MSPIVPFLISLLIGIISAVVAVFFDGKEKDRTLAAMFGIMWVCLGTLASIYIEMGHLKEDVHGEIDRSVPVLKSAVWIQVVKEIADYDHHEPDNKFNDILEDPVRKNIQNAFVDATNGRIAVDDQAEVVRITSELMNKASDSILATSYIDPNDWWNSNIGENYSDVIASTKKHVNRFDRLFIVESDQEARLLSPILAHQKEIGLDVHYVCAISLKAPLRRDFIVIDDSVGAELSLDSGRHFERATFYSTREEAENLSRVYKDLLVQAKIFDPKKGMSCPQAAKSDSSPTQTAVKSKPR